MPNDTTVAPTGDAANTTQEPDWAAKYKGLQRVVSDRDSALLTSQAEYDRLKGEHEQALADLNTYRQRDVETSEEEQARAQYEDLKTRFEAPAPTPVGNNAARDWTDSQRERYGERERTGTSQGFPV